MSASEAKSFEHSALEPKIPHFQTVGSVGFQAAPNGKRVLAFLIDSILVGFTVGLALNLVVFPLLKPFLASKETGEISIVLFTIVSNVFGALFYFVPLTLWLGATPGKKAMGLKVINLDNSLRLSVEQLILREIPGRLLSAWGLGLGYFTAFFRKDRRTWHDRIAKTKVVEYR